MQVDTHNNSPSGATIERLGYSVQEFAAATPCSVPHVWRLIASGKLRAIKVGRRTIIPASAAREMFEGKAA